jgi:hypothetical protein
MSLLYLARRRAGDGTGLLERFVRADPGPPRTGNPRSRAGILDSRVYYRGRVLAELRKTSRAGGEGIALRDLGRRVRQDFDEGDPYWLLAAVESLCKDGLAKIETGPEAADVPRTAAEERVTYGAGAQQSDSLSLDRAVSLP